MNQRIVYQNPDGTVSILIPADCGLTIDQIAAKDVPPGVPFEIVDISALPVDRAFRNAWTKAGSSVSVDMPRARDIHRERLREMRKPRMEALDVESIRAIESSDTAKQAEIAIAKQALRDVTDDPAIEAANTPEELKAVIPDVLKTPLQQPARVLRGAKP